MKKVIFTVCAIVVTALLLSSCGRVSEESYEEPYNEEIAEVYENRSEETTIDGLNETTEVSAYIHQPILTTAHLLDDLDYILNFFENNFALFDAVYWAHGMDIYTIIENLRATILSNPDMDVDEFFHTLFDYFIPSLVNNIAHFWFLMPGDYQHASISQAFSRSARARLSQPHVLSFYEPRQREFEARNEEDEIEEFLRYSNALEHFFNVRLSPWLAIHGRNDLADELALAFLELNEANAGDVMRLFNYADGLIYNAPNVTTRILDEGRIAYMSVNSFMSYPIPRDEMMQIYNFYEDIRDFEHLIIDLRVNGGGIVHWFYSALVSPNIETPFTVEGFVFLVYGEYISYYVTPRNLPTLFRPATSGITPIGTQLFTIDEILADHDLPELNLADMERMDYGFRIHTTVNPRVHYPRFSTESTFSGEIWILTGPLMGSAAQISAWVVKESGFATLVGETTGGNYGGPRTLVTLPNSGIAFQIDMFYVTDSHGRPLEAGTVPHIFNREGMDALETVLAVIAEGDY